MDQKQRQLIQDRRKKAYEDGITAGIDKGYRMAHRFLAQRGFTLGDEEKKRGKEARAEAEKQEKMWQALKQAEKAGQARDSADQVRAYNHQLM